MTSNVGARLITEKQKPQLGFKDETGETEDNDFENTKNLVMGELKKLFRPEFLNRIDDTIVFHKLNKDEIKQIAKNMLVGLTEKMKEMEINMEFDDSAVTAISDAGFDDVYGARPLRRAIQNKLEDIISEGILEGTISKGKSYECTYADDKYSFTEK